MTHLVISNQVISTHNGLFSLNDLHKSSGGNSKHQPTNFMRNAEVQELIVEIEQDGTIAYQTIQGGNTKIVKQGTYACRELVYRYAMWISARFSLMVIRAFDALNTGAIPCLPKLSSDDTVPLRNAVSMATGVLRLDYATIYKMVHQRFGIGEIKELSKEQVGQAVEYVHGLMAMVNQPTINMPFIQNILADNAYQNQKARLTVDGMIDELKVMIDYVDELRTRLTMQDRLIGALQTRFIG